MREAFSLAVPAARGVCLLFHGLTATPSEVEPLAKHLHAHKYTVVVPRLSGHGTSLADLKRTTVKVWIEDTERAFEAALAPNLPLAVIGESLGSLLALNLAADHPEQISKLVVCSPSLRFRDFGKETLLNLFACLPDPILDTLWTVKKIKRPPDVFAHSYESYDSHATGAVARLVSLRKSVLPKLPSIRCSTLVFHDPEDHHLAPSCPEILKSALPQADVRLMPGGQHELLLGRRSQEIFEAIRKFLESH